MKLIICTLIIASTALSCSQKSTVQNNPDNLDAAPSITYDTTAIDSFGPGATSESVMSKINAVAIKREKDSLAAIAKAEQAKLDKEKAEKEAQKAKEEKKENKAELPSSSESTIN
jgi:competence protein ComGC